MPVSDTETFETTDPKVTVELVPVTETIALPITSTLFVDKLDEVPVNATLASADVDTAPKVTVELVPVNVTSAFAVMTDVPTFDVTALPVAAIVTPELIAVSYTHLTLPTKRIV